MDIFSPTKLLQDPLLPKLNGSEVSFTAVHPLTLAGKSFKEELKDCTPIAHFDQSECCDITQVGTEDNAIFITKDKYTLIVYD